ncbi:hypothetical protein [Halobacillus ihumii]|nr:hypothetical protein [Halobacillus ihumii]
MKAEVIDELNQRREEALDNDKQETYESLSDFYNWFVERYIL